MSSYSAAVPLPARHSLAVTTLLGGAVLWGLFWWPLKTLAAGGIQGSFIQVIAYGLPALVLTPLAWRNRDEWRGRLGLLAGIALLGGWANASFATALTYGSVVRVMLLFYLAPVWTVLAARLFLGEPITRLRLAALGLAMSGLFATLGGPEIFSAALSGTDLLALSSGLAFALNNVVIRAGHGLPEAVRSTAVFAGCALFAAGFMVWQGAPLPALSGGQAAALAALALLWVLPGTLATFYGVARLEAGKAAILLLAELVVGVFSAMLIGGEVLSLQEVLGGSLILAAAVIEARTESPGGEETA
jgi:drug/metabolite transporter (DMT)-like permease